MPLKYASKHFADGKTLQGKKIHTHTHTHTHRGFGITNTLIQDLIVQKLIVSISILLARLRFILQRNLCVAEIVKISYFKNLEQNVGNPLPNIFDCTKLKHDQIQQ